MALKLALLAAAAVGAWLLTRPRPPKPPPPETEMVRCKRCGVYLPAGEECGCGK